MKRYTRSVLALTNAYLKRSLRDKVALFFVFIFPVMFLLVFGSINRGTGDLSFEVAVLNQADNQFATEFVGNIKESGVVEIDESVTDIDEAKEMMSRGELSSVIELPKDFGVANQSGLPSGNLIVYYQESSPQSGQTLAAVMEGILDEINQEITQVQEPFSVESRSTAASGLTNFDYIFSGLLGFTVLSLGIFGLANGLPAEKKTGVFRRIKASPIGASHLILANGLNYLVLGLMSLAAMFTVALLVFDFQMQGDYLSFIIFGIISLFVMFGFGLAIGGWAKNENQSAPLSNLVAFPMMFLSGVFFPRFLMPDWLQAVSGYLPLSPIVDGFRFITTEGATLLDLGPQLLMLAVWAAVIYTVSFKLFRWE